MLTGQKGVNTQQHVWHLESHHDMNKYYTGSMWLHCVETWLTPPFITQLADFDHCLSLSLFNVAQNTVRRILSIQSSLHAPKRSEMPWTIHKAMCSGLLGLYGLTTSAGLKASGG